METLETIYWLRLALGVTAAFICTGYGLATGATSSTSFTFLNGLSLALITYLISYYIIKSKFLHRVENTRKLLTTGLGIYFISWMVFWILLYTLIVRSLV